MCYLFSLQYPAPPAIYPLSLHDALPISARLFKLAADQGYADAQFNLGSFYRDGSGGLAEDERRSEEHTSELQSLRHLVCRLLLEKKNTRVAKSEITFTANDYAMPRRTRK